MSTFQELLEKMGLKGHKENTEALGFSERMKKMFHMKEKFAEIPEKEVLTEILQSDMENIRGTMESLDKEAFSMAAELIQNAKKIYIVGIRSCEPLADFLGFYLNMLFDEVHVVRTNSASEIFEQLMRIGAGDVLIGISFPKYSMRTVKAMELANAICANAQIAVCESKRCIRMGMQTDIHTGSAFEAEAFGVTCGTEDKNEGMGAFLEKRAEKHFQNR